MVVCFCMRPYRVLWIESRSFLHVELELSVSIPCMHETPRIIGARREDVIPIHTAYNKRSRVCSVIFRQRDKYNFKRVNDRGMFVEKTV